MVSTAQCELHFCPWRKLEFCSAVLRTKNIYTDAIVNIDRLANDIVIDMDLLAAAVCSFVQYKFCCNQVKLTAFHTIKLWSGLT